MTAKQPDKSQVERFREVARELETDDREEAFDRVLRKVTKAPHSLSEPRKLAQKTRTKSPLPE